MKVLCINEYLVFFQLFLINHYLSTFSEAKQDEVDSRVYAFLVEECILAAFEGKNPNCPVHGDLHLGQIAPDTVFLDLEDRLRYVIKTNDIS